MQKVCGTSDLEIGWGYVKQVEMLGVTARLVGSGLGLSERPVSIRAGVDRGDVMSQQSVRQAARPDRERRLERLEVAVLTALGERDALVRDAERRAGQALRTMTDDEGFVATGGGRLVRQRRHCARDNPVAAARRRSRGQNGRVG